VSQGYVYMAPSRRLGRSLGVDLVPYKTCSFDCIYCQLGRTTRLTMTPQPGPAVDELVSQVSDALARGPRPDTLTLSGSGEPTLYQPLGELISALARVFRPVAVLTNGSLLNNPGIRSALCGADVVLPSLDAPDEATFQCVNRPHPDLSLTRLVDGMQTFRKEFRGEIWLEIMLLGGVTATKAQGAALARLSSALEPDRIHLNTVVRPPAEPFTLAATDVDLQDLRELFGPHAEVITQSAVCGAVSSIAVGEDAILEILARRPCTVGDLTAALGVASSPLVKVLASLLDRGMVQVQVRQRRVFYSVGRGGVQ
jgi:wyosine [tRNA(Phe)-imidazoG37] synthetase (radical SAM superfamily)